MTTIHNRTAPSRRVPPAAQQPGPATLALRALRRPSLRNVMLRAQIEEQQALEALKERIANRIEADIALLDSLEGDPDIEQDAGEMAEAGCHLGSDPDNEPSLCGLSVERPSGCGDDCEHDPAEDGLGDYDGLVEQGHASRLEVFA